MLDINVNKNLKCMVYSMKLNELKYVCENISLDEYINFRNFVKKSMEHPEWLGDFEKKDIESMLKNGSKIWMYYFELEPVCSMMLIPSDAKSLKKFEINLNFEEVADYGPMMVNPKYVGYNLQYQMLMELDAYCFKYGYKYAVATIHPDNIYSINNFLKDNFCKTNEKVFKRGLRNIYLKKL